MLPKYYTPSIVGSDRNYFHIQSVETGNVLDTKNHHNTPGANINTAVKAFPAIGTQSWFEDSFGNIRWKANGYFLDSSDGQCQFNFE